MGYNPFTNGIFWGYSPTTNHLLTSWDIQAPFAQALLVLFVIAHSRLDESVRGRKPSVDGVLISCWCWNLVDWKCVSLPNYYRNMRGIKVVDTGSLPTISLPRLSMINLPILVGKLCVFFLWVGVGCPGGSFLRWRFTSFQKDDSANNKRQNWTTWIFFWITKKTNPATCSTDFTTSVGISLQGWWVTSLFKVISPIKHVSVIHPVVDVISLWGTWTSETLWEISQEWQPPLVFWTTLPGGFLIRLTCEMKLRMLIRWRSWAWWLFKDS